VKPVFAAQLVVAVRESAGTVFTGAGRWHMFEDTGSRESSQFGPPPIHPERERGTDVRVETAPCSFSLSSSAG
jgi:hypothetical protein